MTCRDTRLAAERLVGRGLLPSVPLVLNTSLVGYALFIVGRRSVDLKTLLFPLIDISVTIINFKVPFWVYLKTTFYVL